MNDRHRTFANPAPTLDSQAILVTGGTGSFGRSFVHWLLTQTASRR